MRRHAATVYRRISRTCVPLWLSARLRVPPHRSYTFEHGLQRNVTRTTLNLAHEMTGTAQHVAHELSDGAHHVVSRAGHVGARREKPVAYKGGGASIAARVRLEMKREQRELVRSLVRSDSR